MNDSLISATNTLLSIENKQIAEVNGSIILVFDGLPCPGLQILLRWERDFALAPLLLSWEKGLGDEGALRHPFPPSPCVAGRQLPLPFVFPKGLWL